MTLDPETYPSRAAYRKAVIEQAKELGLPATGKTEEIADLVRIATSDPASWSEADLKKIAPHLSIHQDVGENSSDRVDSMMREGVDNGMVDSLGNMLSGRWSWGKGLRDGDAYVFLSGKLKFKSKDSPRLAPGNIPLFHMRTKKGQSIFDAIKTATRPAQDADLDVPMLSRGKADPGPNQPNIDSRVTEILKLRAFWDSASDVLRERATGLGELADRVDKFFDQWRTNQARAYGMMFEALRKVERQTGSGQVYDDFRRYQAAKENGRTSVADNIRNNGTEALESLIAAWEQVADHTGRANQEVGVQVYDPKQGKWRTIGRVKGFWPRVLNQATSDAMNDPYLNEKTYQRWVQMGDELIAAGHIESHEEMGKFLNTYFSHGSNDYFAGMEKARQIPLPESFYEYGIEGAIGYIENWARRLAQIENFGQKTTAQTKDAFDQAMGKTTSKKTEEYINAVRERVYNEHDNTMMTRGVQRANMVATAIHLGNPATASLNLIGGTTLNVMAYGWVPTFRGGMDIAIKMMAQNPKRAWKTLTDDSITDMLGSDVSTMKKSGLLARQTWRSFKDLTTLPEGLWREMVELGVLRNDFMQIHNDAQFHGLSGSGDAILGKAVSLSLKAGGYTPFEYFIRTNAALSGRHMLNGALKHWNKNIESRKSRAALAWFQRNKFDTDKLIAENGQGPETNRFIRYASNLTNGTYQVDQTPLWIDTLTGKTIGKYQKFLTQVNRLYYRNFHRPMIESLKGGEKITYTKPDGTKATGKGARVKPFLDTLRFFAAPAIAFNLLLGPLREGLFGYVDPSADDDEIEKLLEDDKTFEAFILLAENAWFGIMGMGALGLVGNYGQAFYDIADRQRMKNPLDPPALAPIKGMGELLMRAAEQGTLTRRDIDDVLTQTVSQYRTGKRVGLTSLDQLTEGIREVELEALRRDKSYARKMARRYADENDIVNERRMPARFAKTPMSPINRKVYEEVMLGNHQTVRMLIKQELMDTEKYPEIDDVNKAMLSIRGAVRARDPIRISASPSDEERYQFMEWLKDRVGEENYTRVERVGDQYRETAAKAGLMSPVNEIEAIMSKVNREIERDVYKSDEMREFAIDQMLSPKN